MIGGIALEHLRQHRLGAREPDELRVLIERDSHRAGLLGERLEDRLAHPPHGVRDELHALVGIELADGLEQSFVADRHELREIEPVSLVLLHVRDDEPEIRRDEPLGGGLVSLLREPGETSFLGRVGDQRELLDVLEVLVERRGRRGAEETLGSRLSRMLHTHPGAALGSERALWTRTSSRTCRREGQDMYRYTRRSTPKSYANVPGATVWRPISLKINELRGHHKAASDALMRGSRLDRWHR